jgi:hypothetical protein
MAEKKAPKAATPPAPKKETVTYTVEFSIEKMHTMSIAERKNAIEGAFAGAKEKALADLAKNLG